MVAKVQQVLFLKVGVQSALSCSGNWQDLRQFLFIQTLLLSSSGRVGPSFFLAMETKALVHLVSVEKDGIFVSTRHCTGLRPVDQCRWDRWALFTVWAGTIWSFLNVFLCRNHPMAKIFPVQSEDRTSQTNRQTHYSRK